MVKLIKSILLLKPIHKLMKILLKNIKYYILKISSFFIICYFNWDFVILSLPLYYYQNFECQEYSLS